MANVVKGNRANRYLTEVDEMVVIKKERSNKFIQRKVCTYYGKFHILILPLDQ